ncbi:polysaccharide deacetylase family protein [Hyunsoonleella flava]|uniref:Polysaccharide deacetylase family protein n=2 Tax=Hyunsoonleella flava TaxID=2527939 RepID=A0A4V2J9U6_9FLAO|nr:polysaccharide deacetylase family protein [Hyunsoonleella flava]
MPLTPVKTPKVVKSLFPNYVWNIDTLEKEIYLTFDDGPTPEITEWTLNILEQYQAKATFFCIGANVEKHPEIFKKILDAGHSIGNHTQHHIKGWKVKNKAYLKDVEACETVYKSQMRSSNSEIVNQKSLIANFFRPPYGKITPKQGKSLIEKGYSIVMWDVLSFDWDKNVSKEECYNNVVSKAKNGSIIVFHDSVKASKNMQYALPKVLEHYSKSEYEFRGLNSL